MKEDSSLNDNNSVSSRLTEEFLHLLMANDKRIYAFILAMVNNCADADDLMQETTTIMWRKFKEFEPDRDFTAWGMGIAHYRILNFRKKQRNRRVQFSDRILELLQTDTTDMLKEMDIRTEALQRCLGKLTEPDRQLLKMRYEQSYTNKNIAMQIETSIHRVYRTMAKIHDMLLRCIRRTLAFEGLL